MSGRKVTLFRLLAVCAIAVLSHALPAADAPRRPNVLYIMTDQQFADALSCRMGTKYLHTPNMDSLAAGGAFFTRAYVANPLCKPSRNAIFTGRYPHETGVTSNEQTTMDTSEFVCMGKYFQQAGYDTAYFGKWHLCIDEADVAHHGFAVRAPKNSDDQCAANSVAYLKQKHDKPFLLVSSFLNPHNICEYARGQDLPLGPIGDPPPPDKLPPAPANLLHPINEPDTMSVMRESYHASPLFPVGNFTPAKWREVRWAYYRLIEKADAEIGKVLDALKSAGLEENTLIIFTADHGECAGAHGFNQKTVLYEESVRVPLIVTLKGTTTAGATSDKLVNTGVDILPTMFDFCGIQKPAKLTGLSLKPLATGQPVDQWRNYVVVENDMVQGGPVGTLHPSTQGRMVRTEQFKYCLYEYGTQRESLIDLKNDPGETKNLATDPAHHQTLLDHRAILRRFAEEHHDRVALAMLADDVKPNPFTPDQPNRQSKTGQRAARKGRKAAGE